MHLFLYHYLVFLLMLGTAHSGCSQKCQPDPTDDEAQSNNSTSKPPLFPCSCSLSCSVYRDCCYDSQYRDSDRTVKISDTMCLSLEGTGHFRAVAKCPKHWPGAIQFCGESIGYLPPVTSKSTGVTYANVYCAVCHEDGEDLVTWNVELRCCKEHESQRDRYFSYRQEHLWSRLASGGRRCLCRYRPHHNSTTFLSGLELRHCGRNREISRCSSSWTAAEGEEERLCPLYKDPVYAGEHVFKNPHCAKCNFKEERDTQCVPAVVAKMVAEGANFSEIAGHCQRHGLAVCLHYMRAMSKGYEYSFSKILNINTASCVPDPGKNCCEGYRYHFKSKRCRKLHSSNEGRGR